MSQLVQPYSSAPEINLSTCWLCGSEFKQKEELDLHLNSGCTHIPTPTFIEFNDTAFSYSPQQAPDVTDNSQAHFEELFFRSSDIATEEITDNYFEDRKFSCSSCLKRFKRKDHLKKHLTSCASVFKKVRVKSEQINVQEAYFGEYMFNSSGSHITRDMVGSSEERKYPCSFCFRRFKRKDHLKRHLKTCASPLNVMRNMYVNTEIEKKYPCECCKKLFSRKDILKRHLSTVCRTEGSENAQTFICFLCGSVFFIKERLVRHIYGTNKHVRSSKRQFRCLLCQFKFVSRDKLHRHVKRHIVNEDYQHQCSSCNTTFDSSRQLLYHEYKNKNKNSCCICKATFSCQIGLQMHLLNKEGEIELFTCFICGVVCMVKSDLKIHILVRHTQKEIHYSHRLIREDPMIVNLKPKPEAKLLCCDICNFVLLNRQSYILHMQLHNNIKAESV